jgi:hypothetical protein
MENKVLNILRDIEKVSKYTLTSNINMRLDKVLTLYLEDLDRAYSRAVNKNINELIKELIK